MSILNFKYKQAGFNFHLFCRKVLVFMAMFPTRARPRDIFTCIRYFMYTSQNVCLQIKVASGQLQLTDAFVAFAGRISLGSVHGKTEDTSKKSITQFIFTLEY